jgi:tetratricopeptide (TPR) repeat protein
VRKSGTRLRITAQLINSASGYHLWSQTFEGDASDVFKVQDDISTAIAEVLETKLAGRPAADKPAVSVDPQAYDDYLQGRALTARRVDDNLKLAVAAFDRAIARDPSYSAAHAGRAFALALSEIWVSWLPTADIVAQGRASAVQALKLDPDNVEAMISRGYLAMKHWDIAGARVDFERAYALAPENVDVLNFYGDFQKLVGNLREAERMKRKAMALDPLSFVHPHDLLQVLFDQGRPRDALVMAERAESLGSPNAPYQILEAHKGLKQFDDAERALAKLCPEADAQKPGCRYERMSLLAATGRLAEARAIFAELVAMEKGDLNVEMYSTLAAVYAVELKDIPKATRDLRMALQGNSWNVMNPLRWGARGALLPEEISQDPEWLAVWADPKLRDLMAAYRANIANFRKGG